MPETLFYLQIFWLCTLSNDDHALSQLLFVNETYLVQGAEDCYRTTAIFN